MAKTDMNTGLDLTSASPFWSENVENYPVTDVPDIYKTMKKHKKSSVIILVKVVLAFKRSELGRS
jgi:hypothetical protein